MSISLARHSVLVTIVGSSAQPTMEIHDNFGQVPRVGEYIKLEQDRPQAYRVMQVVHCLGEEEYDYAVTVEKAELSHPAILTRDNARDS
jgi:hypothetical protein